MAVARVRVRVRRVRLHKNKLLAFLRWSEKEKMRQRLHCTVCHVPGQLRWAEEEERIVKRRERVKYVIAPSPRQKGDF